MTQNKRLFVDMDGTLARFHDEAQYLERMWEKDFFRDLKPFENMVKGLKEFMHRNPETEVFILSAAIDGEPPYCRKEKHAWLDKYLPEIDPEHRLFTKVGVSKSVYIPGGITADDVLLDDYNVGLECWVKDGGTAVKCVNNINHKGLNGPLWEGTLLRNGDTPEQICKDLEGILKEQPKAIFKVRGRKP